MRGVDGGELKSLNLIFSRNEWGERERRKS
jgi:hypothetical protein